MKRRKRTIRLGCRNCDRDDHDGITPKQLRKAGWQDVERFQTYRQSVRPSPPAKSVFDWWTHLGLCPECVAGGVNG